MPIRVRTPAPAGKAAQGLLDVECGLDGGGGMVGERQRQVEAGKQAVADEIVHHAAVPLDDRHHGGEVGIQDLRDLGRRHALRQAGEALDVGEHQGGLGGRVGRAARALAVVEDGRGDALAHILAERVAQVFAFREALDHLVEAADGVAHLVVRRHRQAHREVVLGDPVHAVVESRDRLGQRPGDPVVDDRRSGDRRDDVHRRLRAAAGRRYSSRCRRPTGSCRQRTRREWQSRSCGGTGHERSRD